MSKISGVFAPLHPEWASRLKPKAEPAEPAEPTGSALPWGADRHPSLQNTVPVINQRTQHPAYLFLCISIPAHFHIRISTFLWVIVPVPFLAYPYHFTNQRTRTILRISVPASFYTNQRTRTILRINVPVPFYESAYPYHFTYQRTHMSIKSAKEENTTILCN
jgi:hypothetical protein